MITVRFPSGVAVQYNQASYLMRGAEAWNLSTKRDGEWVASIQPSAGVIVEAVQPCAVSPPPTASPDDALLVALKLIEAGHGDQIPSSILRDLKRALGRYNARSGCWR